MKKNAIIFSLISMVFLVSAVQAASTVSLTSLEDAVNSVYVSSVTLDPEVFYPGETGTVTVHLNNSGTMTVTLGSPMIYDPNIEVHNADSFTAKSRIGGGDNVDYTFQVSVNASAGKNTFFPIFSVNPDVGNAVHASFPLKTDSGDLEASVSGQPDTFTRDNSGQVNLTLINPRDAAIQNIHISATGTGLAVNPSDSYVSNLGALNSTTLIFSVTPSQDSNLFFNISFTSSGTVHNTDVMIPVTLGVDKTAAVPVVNNPSLSTKGSYYDLTADISNAGVSDAKGVIVTVSSPAKPTGTYPEYAVGTLSADDASSFEVTFTSNDLSNVPLEITWKDASGNNYNTTKVLDLSSSGSGSGTSGSGSGSGTSVTSAGSATGSSSGSGGMSSSRPGFSLFGGSESGLSAFYPVIAGGIVIVIAAVLWVKRRSILAKIKKQ